MVQPARLGDGSNRQRVDRYWHVQNKGRLAGRARPLLLTGFATADLISFTVNFGHFSTLTSWAGQYAKEKNEPEMLHTCFVAAVDIKEALESRDIWGGVKVGSDFFQRTEWTWPGSRLKAQGGR